MADIALMPQGHILERRIDRRPNDPPRPVRFSERTGFRLCGIALDPFWPGEKNSSASRTSERCRCRTSMDRCSIELAMTPSTAKNMA